MPTHFHQELEQLKLKVLEMAAYAERSAEKATRAFFERDAELAAEVIESDSRINLMDHEIDEFCLKLLALEQPMAVDLRFIVGSMRTTVHLERVGDQAVNIAERAILLSQRPPLPLNRHLEELSSLAREMLKASIVSYNNGDPELAQRVCNMDARTDELSVKVLKDLVDYMLRESPAIERSVHTILLARSLERIGDLATNVAENAIFITRGVNFKHNCHAF